MQINIQEIIANLGLSDNIRGVSTGQKSWQGQGSELQITSPVDGAVIGNVTQGNDGDYNKVIETCQEAFVEWRQLPAPQRGEIVRQMGDALRAVSYTHLTLPTTPYV